MLRDVHGHRRIIVPFILACFLLFTSVPVALAASRVPSPSLIGPKEHYLALGDSLAFGFQPNGDFTHGYVNDFFKEDLQKDGVQNVVNLGCPGETSSTFINGGCPAAPGNPPQLVTALAYLQANAGQVSPVTLDIGANDVLGDVDPSTCTVNSTKFSTDLATLDANLTGIILPQLHAALVVNSQVTGDLVMMNYYDPLQNICPNTVPFTEMLNQHLASDVSPFGIIVDVFGAFGGARVPNPHICKYTWMCNSPPNIHATDKGYEVIADTFDKDTGD